MKIIFRDRNQPVVDALKISFRGISDIEISQGDFFDIQANAVISPNNSFVFMNGGIDDVIEKKLHVEHKFKQFLIEDIGELLVGEAIIAKTNDPIYKYVVAAPTMRVPMNIQGTVNVYLAFKAALVELLLNNEILEENKEEIVETVLCPGMGTGIGQLDPLIAAQQMREAYNQVILSQKRTFNELKDAYRFHISLTKGII